MRALGRPACSVWVEDATLLTKREARRAHALCNSGYRIKYRTLLDGSLAPSMTVCGYMAHRLLDRVACTLPSVIARCQIECREPARGCGRRELGLVLRLVWGLDERCKDRGPVVADAQRHCARARGPRRRNTQAQRGKEWHSRCAGFSGVGERAARSLDRVS